MNQQGAEDVGVINITLSAMSIHIQRPTLYIIIITSIPHHHQVDPDPNRYANNQTIGLLRWLIRVTIFIRSCPYTVQLN